MTHDEFNALAPADQKAATDRRLARIAALCQAALLELVADLQAGKERRCKLCGASYALIDGRVAIAHRHAERVA